MHVLLSKVVESHPRHDAEEGGGRSVRPWFERSTVLRTHAQRLGECSADERGQPVREYWLRAFTNDTFIEHAESVMSPDGTFDLQGISPGTVSLAAMFATVHGETPVTLAPGQELDGVRIVLSRGQMHAN